MFVWEVREEFPYEGNNWSVLVRDDDDSLEKVKSIIIRELRITKGRLLESIKRLKKGSAKVPYPLTSDHETRIFQLERGINDLNLTISYVELLTSLNEWQTVLNRGYAIEVEKLEVL